MGSADSRVPGSFKNMGTFEEKVARNKREMAADNAKNASVPGATKNRANFESKTQQLPKVRDIALDDARVLDEEYDYTTRDWPGKMNPDPNLDRAEIMQIRHKPQINADTNR